MAETLSYNCPSDIPAARSVREACLGTLSPLRQEWRTEVLRLGAGLFPILTLNLLFSLLLQLYFSHHKFIVITRLGNKEHSKEHLSWTFLYFYYMQYASFTPRNSEEP